MYSIYEKEGYLRIIHFLMTNIHAYIYEQDLVVLFGEFVCNIYLTMPFISYVCASKHLYNSIFL